MGQTIKIYASQDYVDNKVLENIPIPTVASVGQVIAVKTVDENGKPTEWETTNLPTVISELTNDAGYLTDENLNELESSVSSNTAAIEILNGTGEGSVKYTVADAVATIVANAPEDFDTLKEIADYIANDQTGAADIANRVTILEEKETVISPSTAAVGEAIIVSEVDENGKPTAWSSYPIPQHPFEMVYYNGTTSMTAQEIQTLHHMTTPYRVFFLSIYGGPIGVFTGFEYDENSIAIKAFFTIRDSSTDNTMLCYVDNENQLIFDKNWPGLGAIEAQPGQVITPKTTDENGIPTEWEAINPHILTDTETGVKYQLAVTNGKLTMTEVVE